MNDIDWRSLVRKGAERRCFFCKRPILAGAQVVTLIGPEGREVESHVRHPGVVEEALRQIKNDHSH